MNDPFASAPADEAQNNEEAPVAELPKSAGTVHVDVKPRINHEDFAVDGKHVVTLKGGSGFDAPWYVIHASGLSELEALFQGEDAARLSALFDRIQTAAQFFASKGKNAVSAPRKTAPAEAQSAPAGAPPAPGPDWTFKSGVSKAGKPWKGWMPPRGSDEKPLFF